MTHANLHLIQILPRLPDAENEHDYAWADSAYLDKVFRISLISQVSEVWLIHEKGAHNHPLNEAANDLNRIKLDIRACVKYVFCCMTMSMGGKLTRKIGLERTEACWGLKNLTFNFIHFLQRSWNADLLPEFCREAPYEFGDLNRARYGLLASSRLLEALCTTLASKKKADYLRCSLLSGCMAIPKTKRDWGTSNKIKPIS